MRSLYLVIIVLVIMASSIGIIAAANVVASVSVSPMTPRINNTVTATMRLNSDVAVGSFSATLVYDPTMLRYESNTGILGFTGVVNATQPGRVIFNGVNINGVAGNTSILGVNFTALKPGRTVLDLTYTAMAEAKTFVKITPTVRDAFVFIRR